MSGDFSPALVAGVRSSDLMGFHMTQIPCQRFRPAHSGIEYRRDEPPGRDWGKTPSQELGITPNPEIACRSVTLTLFFWELTGQFRNCIASLNQSESSRERSPKAIAQCARVFVPG